MKRKSKQEMAKIIERVKEKIASGKFTAAAACKDEGIHFSTYYNHLNRSTKPRLKLGKNKSTKRKYAIKPLQIQEISGDFSALGKSAGKTLILITEDAETVNNIIAAFR